MRNLNSRHGIGLLELMLSIIVITAVILGATKYYLVAKEAMKITQAQEIINNVAEAAYKWVEGHTDFSSIGDITTLTKAGLLPTSYSPTKGSPWSGGIVLSVVTKDSSVWLGIALANATIKACNILNTKYGACGSYSGLTSCADSCVFYFRSP